MGKIMHNGVEYGGGGYSKKQTDDKLRLKLDKSAVESMLSDSSANPVQNKVVTTELKGKVPQVKTMPISAEDGFAVLYTGTNTATYTLGHIYQYNENDDLWVDITASGGSETIQVEILPTASVSELGNIYQYIGATTATYTNGYFYECVEDSGSYSWVEKEVQKNDEVPHWCGTLAEYEAQKDNIEDGTYVSLTDDIDSTYESGDYSTNEVNTGKRWIDGKPIYRKVFVGNAILQDPGAAVGQRCIYSAVSDNSISYDHIINYSGYYDWVRWAGTANEDILEMQLTGVNVSATLQAQSGSTCIIIKEKGSLSPSTTDVNGLYFGICVISDGNNPTTMPFALIVEYTKND